MPDGNASKGSENNSQYTKLMATGYTLSPNGKVLLPPDWVVAGDYYKSKDGKSSVSVDAGDELKRMAGIVLKEDIDKEAAAEPEKEPAVQDDGPDFDAAALPRVEQAKSRAEENERKAVDYAEQARADYPDDLVALGRMLAIKEVVCYPDLKKINGGLMTVALATDPNRWAAFGGLFGEGAQRPYFDTFRGQAFDPRRKKIIDKNYPVVDLTMALDAMGLKGHSAKEVRNALMEWSIHIFRNSLIELLEKRIPVWDGVPRMRTILIEWFACKDTELNRDIGEYFWLALYSRVMIPGSRAEILIDFIGGQYCGKSWLFKLICELVMDNRNARYVEWRMDGSHDHFLRSITGHSIFAVVNEMTGFARADLNNVKSLVPITSDMVHFKYLPYYQQERQWLPVMDSNRYDGLQRDETGNRRFYPLFCGEKDRKSDGKPDWDINFRSIITDKDDPETRSKIEYIVWQLFAEAATWRKEHGELGYDRMIDSAGLKVKAFNAAEWALDSGTVLDPDVRTFLNETINFVAKKVIKKRDGSGRAGIWIKKSDMVREFKRVAGVPNPNQEHISTAMGALGAESGGKIDGLAGFYFDGYATTDDFLKFIAGASAGAAAGDSTGDDGSTYEVIESKDRIERF